MLIKYICITNNIITQEKYLIKQFFVKLILPKIKFDKQFNGETILLNILHPSQTWTNRSMQYPEYRLSYLHANVSK